jgi:hypothetical protein
MAALRLSLLALLLALCACSLPGRSASAIGGLFGASAAEGSDDASSDSDASASAELPPSGRALTRLAPAPDPHPEDLLLRLPSAMRLAAAETVNAERLGRVEVEGERRVIVLTPLPCRIAEQEAAPQEADDREGCRSLNMATFAARSQQVWTLAPGHYTVRVVNRQVGWPVGLWIRSDRGESLAAAGGGAAGETIEFEVDLAPGNYLVSLPLLPTPDYLWEVKKGAR